jgi:hypothetical protein
VLLDRTRLAEHITEDLARHLKDCAEDIVDAGSLLDVFNEYIRRVERDM